MSRHIPVDVRARELEVASHISAQLPCCRVWYSIDDDTGVPAQVPLGVRLAYLQVTEGEQPEQIDLMFRVLSLRSQRIPLDQVCPQETPQGRTTVNCGNCGTCWQ